MKKLAIRAAALGSVAALAVSVAGPGYAATTVSQADATALTLAIAGQGADSGNVKATNNGSKETVVGETNPPIDVLNNQALANIGVLAQEAEAKVANKQGVSRACSGVAGQGAAVGSVGESQCLTPGDAANINFVNLDLSDVITIDPSSALGPLAQLNPVVQQLLGPITSALSDAFTSTPLGDLNIGGTFGAIQSVCSAKPGSATGAANITDASIGLSAGGQDVNLVTLPAHPAPNTHVLTNLDSVLGTVIDAVEAELTTALTGALQPLTLLTSAIKTQIVDTIVAQIAPQLAPLEDNVLDITLNKQVKSKGAIEVTALSVKVLPAAEQFAGASLISGDIAKVSCGANAKVVDTPSNPGEPNNPGDGDNGNPKPPTVIDAGLDAASGPWGMGLMALAALSLGGAAGVAAQRRLAQK